MAPGPESGRGFLAIGAEGHPADRRALRLTRRGLYIPLPGPCTRRGPSRWAAILPLPATAWHDPDKTLDPRLPAYLTPCKGYFESYLPLCRQQKHPLLRPIWGDTAEG